MEVLATDKDLGRIAEKLAATDEVGLDYETTSFYPIDRAALQFDLLKVIGYGLGFPDGEKVYVPIAHQAGQNVNFAEARRLLVKILTDPNKIVWAHNSTFEAIVSNVLRIDHKCKWRCSMIAQWLLDRKIPGGGGYKLKAASQKFLGHKMIELDDVLQGARAHLVSPTSMAPYCADDALRTLQLGHYYMDEIKELNLEKVFYDLEMPIATEVLPHMDQAGFEIDRDFLYEVYHEYTKEMEKLSDEFSALTDVGISKNQAISKKMYDELQWWPILDNFERGKSGTLSIDKHHLAAIEKHLVPDSRGHKAFELKKRYQTISKITSTYTVSLIKLADRYTDKRLRSHWLQTGTATGRFSSSQPNLQNIPIRIPEGRKIRGAFIHKEGWKLYDRDYSGADLRVFAHLANEVNMLQRFNSEDDDLHSQTAEECKCHRQAGKVANLGLIYEMGGKTLANGVGCEERDGYRLANAWHAAYPKVRRYHARQHRYAEKHGFVRTITGRIRRLPDINSRNPGKRFRAQHESTNTPPQGSVADIIKIAMRNLVRDWKNRGVLFNWFTGEGKAKLQSQVHDELIVELRDDFAEEGADDVRRHMEDAVKLKCPLTTDGGFGSSWLEAH